MNFVPRLYFPKDLAVGDVLTLPEELGVRLGVVLRLRAGSSVKLFNGREPFDYSAVILELAKKKVQVRIAAREEVKTISPLKIHLGQCLAVGAKMDLILQKATELGVDEFTPLISEYSKVKLAMERSERRLEHWQNIAISASEQSGRSKLPKIHEVTQLHDWLVTVGGETKIILDPRSGKSLAHCSISEAHTIAVLVGPESGFGGSELLLAQQAGFSAVTLGPRILRTETAALTLLSILQYQSGDLAVMNG